MKRNFEVLLCYGFIPQLSRFYCFPIVYLKEQHASNCSSKLRLGCPLIIFELSPGSRCKVDDFNQLESVLGPV